MPGPLSGKFAAVKDVTDLLNWEVSEESTPVESITSATQGGRRRSSGVLSASGSYNRKSGHPGIKPFEVLAFEGYTAPDNETYGTTGIIVTGNIYAATITVNMNWAGNEDVNSSVDFQFDQAMTIGAGIVLDPGPPLESSICPCKIEYGDEGAEVEIEHIASATLTFTIDMLEYINSSTDCQTGRKPGPIDWNLEIVLQDNSRPVPIQSDERLKIWINATQYYILEFGHLQSYTTLSSNPSTGEIITQSMSWVMQAHKQSDYATLGAIYWPDDPVNPIWPIAAPTVVATVEGTNDPPE